MHWNICFARKPKPDHVAYILRANPGRTGTGTVWTVSYAVTEIDMFDQTFIEAKDSSNKPLTLAFSLLLQLSVVCILIVIPLISTQVLPAAVFRNLLLAPAAPRAAAPQPPTSRVTPKFAVRTLQIHQLYAPVTIPKRIAPLDQIASAPDIGVPAGGSDANAALGLGLSGVIGSVSGPPPSPEAPAPKKKNADAPIQVASVLQEANLVRRVMPIYPPLAKSARVQGTVEFTALISKEGRVENLRLVHGHPLLVQAAREAIEQWRYRPTILNGAPVEVITDIIVNFTLNQ